VFSSNLILGGFQTLLALVVRFTQVLHMLAEKGSERDIAPKPA